RSRAPQPGSAGGCYDDMLVIGQRNHGVVAIGGQNRHLPPGTFDIALEQQIFQRALQPRELLKQALPMIFLHRPLRLRHLVNQVERAQRNGATEQDQRNREPERSRQKLLHLGNFCNGPGAIRPSISSVLRSSFDCTISVISWRPETTRLGVAPASIFRLSVREGVRSPFNARRNCSPVICSRTAMRAAASLGSRSRYSSALNQPASNACTASGFFSSTDSRTASRSTISPGIWLLSNSVC